MFHPKMEAFRVWSTWVTLKTKQSSQEPVPCPRPSEVDLLYQRVHVPNNEVPWVSDFE